MSCERALSAKNKGGSNEQQEGKRLEQTGRVLNRAAPYDSVPLECGKHDGYRCRDDYTLLLQCRKECPGKLTNNQRYGCSRTARRKPVAPTHNKAGIFAESVARKNVLPAGARNHCAEFCQGDCAGQSVEDAQEPHPGKEPWLWKL